MFFNWTNEIRKKLRFGPLGKGIDGDHQKRIFGGRKNIPQTGVRSFKSRSPFKGFGTDQHQKKSARSIV